MAEEKAAEPKIKFDARLEEGVRYFEQVLQLMPDDRTTLEFLAVAYDQLGEPEKGAGALVSLAKLLLKQGDLTAAAALLPRLEALADDEARILALRIGRLTSPEPELVPEAPPELSPEEQAADETRAAIAAEAELVEQLRSNGLVPEADATRLRDMVAASPADGRCFLVSVLSILEKENSELCERCLAFAADRYATPPVSIAAFEPDAELVGRFPPAVVRIRGAVPFAKLGDQALVALLNPADAELRGRLAAVMPCRFFLALPSAVEQWLARVFGEEDGP